MVTRDPLSEATLRTGNQTLLSLGAAFALESVYFSFVVPSLVIPGETAFGTGAKGAAAAEVFEGSEVS
jgi:hypothetical protein